MDEVEFIKAIDGRFPYHDRQAALQAIAVACSTSPNAAFAVAFELACPPRSQHVEAKTLLDLVSELDSRLNHPLKELVLGIARRMIDGDRLSLEEALSAMIEISHHPGEHQALNIAYYSVKQWTGAIDEALERIVREWGHARSTWQA